MTYKLSPHSLSVMDDCQRCFWQQQHEKVSRPSGPFPSLPSGMDLVLKAYFDHCRDNGTTPQELKDIPDAKLYQDKKTLSRWRNARQGIRWNDSDGNLLYGALDNLLISGNKLVLLDYKTRGFAVTKVTPGYYKKQMDIYNFLLRKEGHETASYSALLFYHPVAAGPGGSVQFETTLVKVPVDIDSIEEQFAQAVECLNGPKPKASAACSYHHWSQL